MTSLTYPLLKERWTADGWPNVRWSGGVGAALTIGIHALVIGLLLAAHAPESAPPAPLNVSIISATPQPAEQPQPQVKPRFYQPTLHIPQPDIVLADNVEPSAAPAAMASASPVNSEPVAPVQTQPAFDADYLNNPAPTYPPLARRMREQGVVYVRVFVSPEGLPDQIELKRSSGSARLDEAALTTVKKWRFVPARRGSLAVAAWVVVPIAFSLTA